jgi:hypothetical protein
LVHLEASTKPHVHQKFEIFWTTIASTMAYPNFKNGPKNSLGPLGVKYCYLRLPWSYGVLKTSALLWAGS